MRELLTLWRETRMVVLVAVLAAAYAVVLLAVGELVLVRGYPLIEPASALPPVFSLLFGPAAAWGAALGALVGDLFGGVIGWRTGFDVLANFAYGLLGYRLWGHLGPLSSGVVPDMRSRSARQLTEFWLVSLLAATTAAAIVAWGVDLLGLGSFELVASTAIIRRTVPTVVLGPILLVLLWPRLAEQALVYPVDRSSDTPARARLAASGIGIVSLGWVLLGIGISDGSGDVAQLVLGAVAVLALGSLSVLSGPYPDTLDA